MAKRNMNPKSLENLNGVKPKKDTALQDWCREKSIECAERVLELVKNEETKDADVIRGAELIMAYGYGKPKEMVDLEVTGEVASKYDLETLMQIAGIGNGK